MEMEPGKALRIIFNGGLNFIWLNVLRCSKPPTERYLMAQSLRDCSMLSHSKWLWNRWRISLMASCCCCPISFYSTFLGCGGEEMFHSIQDTNFQLLNIKIEKRKMLNLSFQLFKHRVFRRPCCSCLLVLEQLFQFIRGEWMDEWMQCRTISGGRRDI